MEPKSLAMVTNISSLSELLAAVRDMNEDGGRMLFRGQGQDWPLLPKAWRPAYRGAEPETRLEDWLDKARALGRVPADKWKQLALAQHHGLATTLLDWSTNPLVALYFAVENETGKKDGVIWCFEPALRFDPTKNKKGTPSSYSMVMSLGRTRKPCLALLMPEFTKRIYCQQGAFTYTGNSRQCLATLEWPCDHEYNDGTMKTENLTRLSVPRKFKESLRRELAVCGIAHSRLFPDFDGLSDEMNRTRQAS